MRMALVVVNETDVFCYGNIVVTAVAAIDAAILLLFLMLQLTQLKQVNNNSTPADFFLSVY